ncbi:MAG: HflK protein, partial [Firmicutes bacterium]|nr:HflK protein [Bacillota bacterium]
IDTYEMGVKINDVRIQNISVPKEVSAAYEDVNNAKNEKTKRLDEAERYANEILPKARSTAYETVKQAEAFKAEVVAEANSNTAVFNAVLAEYQLAPEVTRKRLLIETLENILTNSGKIIIADNTSDLIKILDLNETGTDTISNVSAVEGGGN